MKQKLGVRSSELLVDTDAVCMFLQALPGDDYLTANQQLHSSFALQEFGFVRYE